MRGPSIRPLTTSSSAKRVAAMCMSPSFAQYVSGRGAQRRGRPRGPPLPLRRDDLADGAAQARLERRVLQERALDVRVAAPVAAQVVGVLDASQVQPVGGQLVR